MNLFEVNSAKVTDYLAGTWRVSKDSRLAQLYQQEHDRKYTNPEQFTGSLRSYGRSLRLQVVPLLASLMVLQGAPSAPK
ncbi:unnamed protein product [Cyprideis torosa]|uniref:Uncharacterized protein n=1 Tax=Cyprideis torosa TaxID=163714 RepID=A0A7R8ZMJ1_9CRUS|nr:unnamed protein product [Cyprideis torosa]CAG0884465.1 unnamed protein product [Cyprideis torosa]